MLNASEIEANDWMILPKEARAAFVLGFLTGLEHLYATTGVKVLLLEPLSTKDLAMKVFEKLTYEPELRNGPIAVVILSTVHNVVTLATTDGSSIQPWSPWL